MKDDTSARAAFLQSIPLFQDMGEQALQRLAEDIQSHVTQPGALIFRQGDAAYTCHIVRRGKVRVFVLGEDGRELSVRILGPGEIIGEMALLDDQPRSASVEALEETETLKLHRNAFMRYVQEHPALALSLLRSLSDRLRLATADAEEMASLTVSERLVRRLRRLAEWSGKPVAGGTRITLPMTQEELATLVGTSRESVNRALVRLRREGKVTLKDGWIVLSDDPD
ncbi:MAG: Crp/Fnr family transcriptional regulator [Anaerolineae bacterium]|nr:Crp/Fnr family transcriptional regulator [Anaerolineae bacterium]